MDNAIYASVWEKRICRIDGQFLSLEDIENKIIRARFRDPRFHFALNCKYAKPALRKKLEKRANWIEIEYLPYDWPLSGK